MAGANGAIGGMQQKNRDQQHNNGGCSKCLASSRSKPLEDRPDLVGDAVNHGDNVNGCCVSFSAHPLGSAFR